MSSTSPRRSPAPRARPVFLAAALMVTLGLFASGASGEEPERRHGDPGAGRRILTSSQCLRCHPVLGRGGRVAPDLAKLGGTYTYFQLVGQMWGHSPRMIEAVRSAGLVWPKFSPEELEDLVAYLHLLGETQEVGDPIQGEQLVASSCIQCHRVRDRGARVGPSLDFLGREPSGVRLVEAMWNHGPLMSETMRNLGIQRPRFSDTDLTHALAYIRRESGEPGPPNYTPLGDPAAGSEVFQTVGCAGCHGRTGEGGEAPGLTGSGPRGVTQIASRLWNHAPEMAKAMREAQVAIPVLGTDETRDLLAFLGFLGYVDRPADTVRGEVIYSQKGCVSCHGKPGGSDGLVPLWSDTAIFRSRSGIAAALWNHAPAMAEAMAKEASGLSWPRFLGDEARDLIGYLREQAARQDGETNGGVIR